MTQHDIVITLKHVLRSPKSYGISRLLSVAAIVLGILFLGCAWGTWAVNAPKATSAGDLILILLFEVFFVFLAATLIGLRMKFTIYPQEKRLTQVIRLFGAAVKTRSWMFSEVSGVAIRTTSGGKGGGKANVILSLRSSKETVFVNSYSCMMSSKIPASARRRSSPISLLATLCFCLESLFSRSTSSAAAPPAGRQTCRDADSVSSSDARLCLTMQKAVDTAQHAVCRRDAFQWLSDSLRSLSRCFSRSLRSKSCLYPASFLLRR